MGSKQLPSTQFLVRAPGRVNLLGEHTDTNEGPVLPCAIDRSVILAFDPLDDPVVEVHALDLDEHTTFLLEDVESRKDVYGAPTPSFAHYPAGVAWILQKSNLPVKGMRATFTSDVPIGAGLSSSAAVEVAFISAWQKLGGWQLDKMKLAQLCQKVENEFIGIKSGLLDQFASLFGQSDHAIYFDTRTLDWEAIPLPTDAAIVVADSTVRRKLADSGYNDRRDACQTALKTLQKYLPGIKALRDVSVAQFNQFVDKVEPLPSLRARHIVEECERVYQAVDFLKQGNVTAFGELMNACHVSLRDYYGVSVPEIDLLVEIALKQRGCLGARLTGGGFGGCTVNLVRQDGVEAFIKNLKQGYFDATGKQAPVYVCRAAQGAG